MKLYQHTSLLSFLVLLLALWLTLLIGPWWLSIFPAMVYGIFWSRPSAGLSFWPGFLAGVLVWLLGALWFGSGSGDLPESLAELFGLGSATALHSVVALVGGLLVGVFVLVGAYLRAVISPIIADVTG